MIGYVCKYTPIELFAGFGASPSFILPSESPTGYADSRMWPSMCGYAKSVLQSVHGGGYESVVFTDCCDAIKRVSDILRADFAETRSDLGAGGEAGECALQCGGTPVFVIGLPRVVREDSIRAYARSLRAFISEYEKHSGTAFDVRLFMEACEKTPAPAQPAATGYVALLGARVPRSLAEKASELCAVPVRDLTCASHERDFADMPPGAGADADAALDGLLVWYAGRLLAQLPCMRMSDDSPRDALCEDQGIKAVVYHTIQFCDFYGFDYARLHSEKGPGKIPTLKIETDYTPSSSGQLATRLQAFFESADLLAAPSEGSGSQPMTKSVQLRGLAHGSEKAEKNVEGKNVKTANYYSGVDCGSTSTNAVIIDEGGNIAASATVPTGANSADAAARAMDEALGRLGVRGAEAIAGTVATGYGRASVPFPAGDVTEITCHARGARALAEGARTIIDIGGQDSKVIRLDDSGAVAEFSMNDKCAAGTGRFLELMADTLGMGLDELAESGLHPKERVDISSMCAVFAESEVISLIAGGKDTGDIVWGVNLAIAGRVAGMAARLGAEPPYVMTGGVAKNAGVVKAFGEKLSERGGAGITVAVPSDPQICGALGAALIARDASMLYNRS
ncbi:MAG: acyl-CoA dehydratase activase [Clostridiales Family XIII bacterium]|jgi:predicted CoA-substrate-specific enzyme activase|nr:acyl-CoA dehydratase activase [Clostridiales Family XIII bacterium]